MKEFVVDHEIVVEHTLSYLFGAKDILKSISRNFDVAFLPLGHHLYTGILQAASYRGLKRKNKVIIVFEGEDDNKISIFKKSIGPFLGKIWNLDKNLLKLEKQFNFIEVNEYGIEKINSQLNYIRIFFDTNVIIPLFVGSKTNKDDFVKFISRFDIKSDFNLVFVSDIIVNDLKQKRLFNDTKEGEIVLNKALIKGNIIFDIFGNFIKEKSMTLKVLAQSDSYQISGDPQNLSIYLSALAK